MNKLQMAHQMALAMQRSEPITDMKLLSSLCFQYADAMQAEADKREKAEKEKKHKEIREMLNAPNTFVEREGQHFDDTADVCKTYSSSEWQPDWSKAPKGFNRFVVGSAGGHGFFTNIEPQMQGDFWFVGADGVVVDGHGYKGHWKDSMRKRP